MIWSVVRWAWDVLTLSPIPGRPFPRCAFDPWDTDPEGEWSRRFTDGGEL
jgi:hypothetical protein